MTSLAIIIGLGYAFKLFELIFHRLGYNGLKYFFERLRIITKWNFVLLLFCSNYDEIALFSSLELRTIEWRTGFSALSTLACILFVILAISVLVGNYVLIKKHRKVAKECDSMGKVDVI